MISIMEKHFVAERSPIQIRTARCPGHDFENRWALNNREAIGNDVFVWDGQRLAETAETEKSPLLEAATERQQVKTGCREYLVCLIALSTRKLLQ
jgi:hypothetical protein